MTDKRGQSIFEATKHPLVVLVASLLLGAVVVPYATSRIAREKQLRELRVSHAIQALRSSTDADRQLNLVLTAFASFIKDESVKDAAARSALRERVYRLYENFDRDAWWWYWQLLEEARVLRLMDPTELQAMRAAIKDYASNLDSTTKAMTPLWGMLASDADAELQGFRRDLDVYGEQSAKFQRERHEIVARMLRPLLD